ncbi:CAP domain-containing protein [Schizophyllum amplum]|uniref:CAP domain-containing protein n=1 Tax=Schizophyllum amplum TaxID=97359 RepID=A0A550CLX0_9AGAR|nr:CAP domain-containing protein [Auriculariopsis ampla]
MLNTFTVFAALALSAAAGPVHPAPNADTAAVYNFSGWGGNWGNWGEWGNWGSGGDASGVSAFPSASGAASSATATVAASSSAAAPSSAVSSSVAAPSSVASSAEAPSSIASSAASSPSAVSAQVTDDQQAYLDGHNNERAKHGAAALTWSADLASYAQNYGAQCVWEHSGGQYGENLAAGTGLSIADAIQMWNNEAADYDASNPQYSHWTQVVWKGTTEVGCAMTTCGSIAGMDNGNFYVCSYNPPGNYIGEFGENVQP